MSNRLRRAMGRIAKRRRANAELCRMPLTEWLALTRAERKTRLQAARKQQAERTDGSTS
jgi:hypothetical protein